MRLAIVADCLPPAGAGGAERYAAQLATALAERHDVWVLSGAGGPLAGAKCGHVPHQAPVAPTARAGTKGLWHLRDQWRLSTHVAVRRALDRIRPDVVHSHQPQGLSAAVFTAIGGTGTPHVHTAHDLNLLCVRASMTRAGDACGGRCTPCMLQRSIRGRALRANLQRFVAVSEFIRHRHVALRLVPESLTTTIRHGAVPGRCRLRELDDGGVRLGFIGTLAAHKGVLTLLRAVLEGPPDWQLDIAGDGPLRPRVEALAAGEPRVRVLGDVAGERKERFFEELDVLVVPSEWEEPAGMVTVEAAVRGLPALVSDRGGLPETPEALTFRAGDPFALQSALFEAVASSALERASARLLEAQPSFLWSKHLAEVERVLEEAQAPS